MGAEHYLMMMTKREAKQTSPWGNAPHLGSSQLKESCQNLPETHTAQVFSIIGGTDHAPQDKGDNAGDEGLLAVKPVTNLVVHDKHLGLPQLCGQCGVGCGGVRWGEN